MKKLSILMLMLVGFTFTNAQVGGTNWLKLGIHAGIPTGDASDTSDFALGIDAKYQFLNLNSFGVGIATGYTNYFSNDEVAVVRGVPVDGDTGVIPVAALFRYYPTQEFFIGTDLGYGFVTGDVADAYDTTGGFYYRPEVGYHNDNWNIFAYYAGVSGDYAPSNVGIGINYNIIQGQ
ncbi:hypothetical protein GO491_02830 [Flavobacteriaceae bacterium Ap0902]|nr:hypothetical protein [Flavobacteriaceae bacterium Ap0902]